ncbi:MAG: CheR family methyltransferase, partial [Nitrospiraceae bacterium]
EWVRDRYFRPRGKETFELDPQIRQMITFIPLNLAQECYPAMMTNTNAIDLIICRNVLMYFTRNAQQATLTRLQDALVTGGWLAVSPVEASAELLRPLVLVQFPGATFFRKGGHASPDHTVSLARTAQPPWPVDTSVPILDLPSVVPDTPCDPPVLPQVQMPEHAAVPPPKAEPILERARAFADRGRLDEAFCLCQTALGRDRLDPEAHILMAAVCQERGDIPAAREALRRALYLDPNSVPATFLLGSLLFQQGDRSRGWRCMETVATLLQAVPRDEPIRGSGGLTAGRLLETAQGYLAIGSSLSGDSKPSDTQDSRPRNDDPKPNKLTGARRAGRSSSSALKDTEL